MSIALKSRSHTCANDAAPAPRPPSPQTIVRADPQRQSTAFYSQKECIKYVLELSALNGQFEDGARGDIL